MRLPLVAALAVGCLFAAGCGSGTGGVVAGGDASHGKQLFQKQCAACHTLQDAGATGKVGPDLDAAFGSDKSQGFAESTIRQVVADQIKFAGQYGDKGPTMPKDLVKGAEVDDVAAYVASVAGKKGAAATTGASAAPATTQQAPAGGGGTSLAAGKQVFSQSGCDGCHTLTAAGAKGAVGPDLDKLKTYAQKAGKPLEAFIRESIVDPNAYVEKGYPKGVMPTNFGSLPKAKLDALVKFLAASAK